MKFVDLPDGLPQGWDVADIADDGPTADDVRQWIAKARLISFEEAKSLLEGARGRRRARRLLGHAPGYSSVDREVAALALALLAPDMPGPQWRAVGRCWYLAFGEDGLGDFDTWSAQGSKYKSGEPATMWASFAKEEGFAAKSLAWLLRWAEREAKGRDTNYQPDRDAHVQAEIEAMNESHAVVLRGSKVVVLREVYDDAAGRYKGEYLAKKDFIDLHVRKIAMPEDDRGKSKSVPLGKLWFESNWRRSFDAAVFAPGGAVGVHQLNLWRGFAVEATDDTAGWDKLKAHLLDNVAQGDSKSYEYILNWLAAGVQWLDKPIGTALVLVGTKGAGKSILIQLYGRLFGPHTFVTAIGEDIVGKFNDHLETTLLLGVEEAFAPQNRAADGTLKDLITRRDLRLEAKFFSTWSAPNHLRIIMTSNNDQVVRADGAERRYGVFEVQNPHAADPDARRAYFGAVVQQMENGGYEAMLGELLARDISEWNPEVIPETLALERQKLLNLSSDPARSWLHERLTDGVHIVHGAGPGDPDYRWAEVGETTIPVRVVLDDFAAYCRRNGYRSTDRKFGLELPKLLPGMDVRRTERFATPDGTSTRKVYVFPSLGVGREAFAAAVGISAWQQAGDEYEGRE